MPPKLLAGIMTLVSQGHDHFINNYPITNLPNWNQSLLTCQVHLHLSWKTEYITKFCTAFKCAREFQNLVLTNFNKRTYQLQELYFTQNMLLVFNFLVEPLYTKDIYCEIKFWNPLRFHLQVLHLLKFSKKVSKKKYKRLFTTLIIIN